ncbi:RNA polymerase sigma factor [Fodinicola acaciae]|uniref:RNA polymerase sigma factor n=1 Tax=Fodinicola acaciae TaxID=2681555 RepID=UPI0013D59399|nr:sigma-70 family RNA polymerase sigma factor [Fodinicola acaciae]
MDGSSERDQLEDIFRTCHARLLVAAYALTGDVTEAQDVVAEAFMRGVARKSTLLAVDSPEAWLRTVARNVARRRWRRSRQLATLLHKTAAGAPKANPELSPDRVAMMVAIRRLPVAQRETVALHYIADLSVDDVARTLGVSPGTVKSRLSRARDTLSTYLSTVDTTAGREEAR